MGEYFSYISFSFMLSSYLKCGDNKQSEKAKLILTVRIFQADLLSPNG